MKAFFVRLGLVFGVVLSPAASWGAEGMTLVESRMIWDKAPHNAFTDLHRQHGRWYCAFREGAAHVSPDGAVRILVSDDWQKWRSIALLTVPWADLRDPKLTEMPDGRMLVTAGALLHETKDGTSNRSLAWVSKDDGAWDGPHEIGEPNIWMWSCEKHKDALYSFGYFKQWPSPKRLGTKETSPQRPGAKMIRLYRSTNGLQWTPVTTQSYEGRYINETAIAFQEDGRMVAVTRRENGPEPRVARIGFSAPPYTEWTWNEGNHRLNGPALCALADGQLATGARWKQGGNENTSLGWVNAEKAIVTPALVLPSKPETGYPSIVSHDGRLHVSYYASQSGKPAIYVAVVDLKP